MNHETHYCYQVCRALARWMKHCRYDLFPLDVTMKAEKLLEGYQWFRQSQFQGEWIYAAAFIAYKQRYPHISLEEFVGNSGDNEVLIPGVRNKILGLSARKGRLTLL